MDMILPYKNPDRIALMQSAEKTGCQDYELRKFVYVLEDSDLDVYPLMGPKRIELLIYSWRLVTKCLEKCKEQEPSKNMIKRLLHYSLELWFGKEWDECSVDKKVALVHCFQDVSKYLNEEFPQINWSYLIELNLEPWKIRYMISIKPHIRTISELLCSAVVDANAPDISTELDELLAQEGPLLLLLRIIKMFDAGYKLVAANMCLGLLTAWNDNCKTSQTTQPDQNNIIFIICHLFLMIIYDMDINGEQIDPLVEDISNHIAILPQLNEDLMIADFEETLPGCIAIVCKNIKLTSFKDFFNNVLALEEFKTTTLLGIVFMAYRSYITGFLLQKEIKNIDPKDDTQNLDEFKRLMCIYVMERERSEKLLQLELEKQQKQITSHNVPYVVSKMTNFSIKLRKSHRIDYSDAKRITECKTKPAVEVQATGTFARQDIIFYNLPDNSNVVQFTYEKLAGSSYTGWHKAKVVLLVQIIGEKLNEIEGWRYHPGLTVTFMQNLETNLSHYFEDLAIIFNEHHFMEQEFWLTAFYLDPNAKYFGQVQRCAMRGNRRQHTDENAQHERPTRSRDKGVNSSNAKFALLSSTIDVNEILQIANHENPSNDYKELHKMLRKLGFESKIVKDLVSITFQLRNKRFSWAVNWPELRKRCKNLLENPVEKQRLVELNMAEANDRLKFLKVDYQKYRNRPQMDYGCIERGYEGAAFIDYHVESEVEEDDFEEPFEDDDEDEFKHTVRKRKVDISRRVDTVITIVDECPDLSTVFNESSTRLTRSRVAAVKASVREELKRKKIIAETQTSCSSSMSAEEQRLDEPMQTENLEAKSVKAQETLQQPPITRQSSSASTNSDFPNFIDIWSISDKNTAVVNEVKTQVNVQFHSHICDKYNEWADIQKSFDDELSKQSQLEQDAPQVAATSEVFNNISEIITNRLSTSNENNNCQPFVAPAVLLNDAMDAMAQSAVTIKQPSSLFGKFSQLFQLKYNTELVDTNENSKESDKNSQETVVADDEDDVVMENANENQNAEAITVDVKQELLDLQLTEETNKIIKDEDEEIHDVDQDNEQQSSRSNFNWPQQTAVENPSTSAECYSNSTNKNAMKIKPGSIYDDSNDNNSPKKRKLSFDTDTQQASADKELLQQAEDEVEPSLKHSDNNKVNQQINDNFDENIVSKYSELSKDEATDTSRSFSAITEAGSSQLNKTTSSTDDELSKTSFDNAHPTFTLTEDDSMSSTELEHELKLNKEAVDNNQTSELDYSQTQNEEVEDNTKNSEFNSSQQHNEESVDDAQVSEAVAKQKREEETSRKRKISELDDGEKQSEESVDVANTAESNACQQFDEKTSKFRKISESSDNEQQFDKSLEAAENSEMHDSVKQHEEVADDTETHKVEESQNLLNDETTSEMHESKEEYEETAEDRKTSNEDNTATENKEDCDLDDDPNHFEQTENDDTAAELNDSQNHNVPTLDDTNSRNMHDNQAQHVSMHDTTSEEDQNDDFLSTNPVPLINTLENLEDSDDNLLSEVASTINKSPKTSTAAMVSSTIENKEEEKTSTKDSQVDKSSTKNDEDIILNEDSIPSFKIILEKHKLTNPPSEKTVKTISSSKKTNKKRLRKTKKNALLKSRVDNIQPTEDYNKEANQQEQPTCSQENNNRKENVASTSRTRSDKAKIVEPTLSLESNDVQSKTTNEPQHNAANMPVCVVKVKKLSGADCAVLRQPRVLLKRLRLKQPYHENEKRKSLRSAKGSTDTDVSSSTQSKKQAKPSPKSHAKKRNTLTRGSRLAAVKQSLELHSESSTESESYRPKRKIKRPSRYSPTRSPKKMVVTPRSASGLKFRISSMSEPLLDYIEISSSDNEIQEQRAAIEEVNVDVTHPLYEEEVSIVPFSSLKK